MKAGVTARSKNAEPGFWARVRQKARENNEKDEEWQEMVAFWEQLTVKKVVKCLLGVFILASVFYTIRAIITSIGNDIYESTPYTIECIAITFLVATPILFLLHYTVLWNRATIYEEIVTALVELFNPGYKKADGIAQFLYRMWTWFELVLVVFVARWCLVTLFYGPELAANLDSKPANISNATEQERWELQNSIFDSFLGIKGIFLLIITSIFGGLAEDDMEKRAENNTQSSQPDASPGKQQKKWGWTIVLLCGLPYLIGCSIMFYARRKWTTSLDRLFNNLWFGMWVCLIAPFPVLSGWVSKEFFGHFYFTRLFVFTIPAFVVFAVFDILLDIPATALRRCWEKPTSLPEANDPHRSS